MGCHWFKNKLLGKGSYGSVYLAKYFNGSALAVKSSSLDSSSSLEKERKILDKFQRCPEIIQCYGSCITLERGKDVYNLELEYAPGGNLLDLIRGYGGKIPESDAKHYTRSLLRGLSSIHKRGYVHCDLKPDNILVFPSKGELSRLKIADFGLAKELQEKQTDDGLLFRGTPFYMSPESVGVPGEIEPALDVWSLGCIVLEMITGEHAWEGVSGQYDLLVKLLRYESPRIRGGLSEIGRDFLTKCLASDTTQRWTVDMLLNHPFVLEDFTESPPAHNAFGMEEDEFIQSILQTAMSPSDQKISRSLHPPFVASKTNYDCKSLMGMAHNTTCWLAQPQM